MTDAKNTVSDERLAELIRLHPPGSPIKGRLKRDVAAAIAELQSLRASIPGGVGVKRDEVEELIEQLLDAQQDINLAANERMDQSLCDASALIDKTETTLRRILSALDLSPADTQCCMCGKTGLSTIEGDGGTECQLEDGRWTCSQDCYYTAVDWFSRPRAAPSNPVVSDEVVEAAKCLLAHWDKNDGPEKRGEFDGVQYWSPAGRMVDTDFIADLRAALSVKPQIGETS